MILLESRFKFGEEIKKAEVIDATDRNKVRVNGTEFFERIPLKVQDLETLNYEENKKFGWATNRPLSSGKWKVTYNQVDYFMTYLDQLDLFKTVVQQED